MKITETQLDEYIALCRSVKNSTPERTIALAELRRLIDLVLYLIIPVEAVELLEKNEAD